jgi:hypothetical protein
MFYLSRGLRLEELFKDGFLDGYLDQRSNDCRIDMIRSRALMAWVVEAVSCLNDTRQELSTRAGPRPQRSESGN